MSTMKKDRINTIDDLANHLADRLEKVISHCRDREAKRPSDLGSYLRFVIRHRNDLSPRARDGLVQSLTRLIDRCEHMKESLKCPPSLPPSSSFPPS